MKKLTKKLWWYGINFLMKAIIFNFAAVFAIVALVHKNDGFGTWAIASSTFAGLWFVEELNVHYTWYKMSIQERALYLTIRKHGKDIVDIDQNEVRAKYGQKQMKEVFTDTDVKLEVGMLINGTATLINVFVGIKWLSAAKLFNKHEGTFEYIIKK